MSTTTSPSTYRFDDFVLDVANRQLQRGAETVDLSGRYLDALVLLVRAHGQLVEKSRFFDEVWGDVVVSDSALTQCIKDIRKHLGDDAANPRYIETVPRYGYRFIAPVAETDLAGPEAEVPDETAGDVHEAPPRPDAAAGPPEALSAVPERVREVLLQGVAGTVGGGVAGVLGGLFYGFALAYAPLDSGLGTASILVVLVGLNLAVGLLGGFGVSFGLAAADVFGRGRPGWRLAGAALGGLVVGTAVKLLGVDAFTLLFGRAPAGITGGFEGAVLGAAIALGARLGGGLDAPRPRRPVAGAALAGAAAGVLIPLAGGRLMGGSLELLARSFERSRLQVDALGRFFGEVHFGTTTQVVSGGLEGLLFAAGVVGAIVLARRGWLRTR